jgi:2-phosphosulfolactate phosphatase
MNMDVVLAPDAIDRIPRRDLSRTTCVVFDVLRATSTITTALAHGVREIIPVCTVEEALALRAQHWDAVLAGERGGDPISGFDIGNSPLECIGLSAHRMIMTTTNGTIALCACATAARIYAGSLLNMRAVASATAGAVEVLAVCAGTGRDPALEDILAAGMLCAELAPSSLTDAAKIALAVSQRHRGYVFETLANSQNGRALISKGRRNEVEWCARVSQLNVLGELRAGAILQIA